MDRHDDALADRWLHTDDMATWQRDVPGTVASWRARPVAEPSPTWLEGLRTPALALVVVAVLCIGLSLVALSAAMDLQRTLALGKAGMADQQQARR